MLRERAPVTVPPDRTLVDDVERRVGAPLLADARRLQRCWRRGRVLHSGHPDRRRRRRGQSWCHLRVARTSTHQHARDQYRMRCVTRVCVAGQRNFASSLHALHAHV